MCASPKVPAGAADDYASHPDAVCVRAFLVSLGADAAALWGARDEAGAFAAGLERYVMGLLAPKVFGVGGADAVEDSVLQARISARSRRLLTGLIAEPVEDSPCCRRGSRRYLGDY